MDSRDFPLSSETKQAILSTIFDCNPHDNNIPQRSIPNDSYFSYYKMVVEDSRAHHTTNTHQGIADLVNLFKRPEATRKKVENILRGRLLSHELDDSKEMLENWIALAARLLLMMPTGGLLTGQSLRVSGETKLNWKDGTMEDLLNREIVPQTLIKESIKLEKIFNARNLEFVAGIRIRWTSNLADHLRMTEEDTVVEIFHYVSFLRFHKNCRVLLPQEKHSSALQTQTRTIFPPALIDETLRTLALLLPEHDRGVEKWFAAHQKRRRNLPLDPLARECGQLKVKERKIENFEYWHDRLVILKQAFDEAEPRNIKQWWYDRRKRVQWYTFWVAALVLTLTIIFGVIQCVEGALQVYLATGRSFT